MRELLNKYRSGELKPEELRKLRDRLESMSEDEAVELMPEDIDSNVKIDHYDPEVLSRIKKEVDSRIEFSEGNDEDRDVRSARFFRIFSAVAAVVVVFLLGAVAYLWIGQHSDNVDMETVVSTCGSQKAVVRLPDGSLVTMRGDSKISYPKNFGDAERDVNFVGQGYFEVVKDQGHPFCIAANGFSVTVLGTSFSLRSNDLNEDAEIILDSGSVSLKTEKSNESAMMEAGEVAIINRMTGKMKIMKKADAISADWKTDELVYTNVSPDSLINSLETAYQITLSPAIKQSIRSNFTGTLPWNDLATTLKILSRIYGFELPY